jgi:hypothetical protein
LLGFGYFYVLAFMYVLCYFGQLRAPVGW